jgi:LacI family transcriptional regulator
MINETKKISMKDIARELNISITTVSFVVNGKSKEKSISPATVKKVNDLIEKKGFNPNSAARILRTGKSKTIGLIVEDISNNFFGNVAKVVEIEAHKRGYSVFFSSTENNDYAAIQLINKMKNSSVDGFIITATEGLKEEILKLKKENVPFVLLDRLVSDVDTNYVILDNFRGAYDLTRHLIENGYTNIGFVSIINGMSQMVDREKGFYEAMNEAEIAIPENRILRVAFGETDQNVLIAIKEYLKKNTDLDALFFATNYLGVFGIEALQCCKLKIPTDIAVVCFDDNDIFRLLTPSITVAGQPINEIATQSIELLMEIIDGSRNSTKMTGKIIRPVVIIRESSAQKVIKGSVAKL